MQPVADQIIAFLLIILSGILVGVIFELYRFLRQLWHPGRLGTNLGDAVFWLFITLFIYVFLLRSTWGEVRLYVFLAIGLGLLIYQKYFGKYIRFFTIHIYLIIISRIKIIIKIGRPVLNLVFKILFFPIGFLKKIFLFIHKFFPPNNPPPKDLS